MTTPIIQIASPILPLVVVLGTETEWTNDLVTHPSLDVDTEYLEYKTVHIMATEVIVAGALGALWCWIEISPVPAATSELYYTAIGGGGGPLDPATGLPYIPPVAPMITVPVGVTGTAHSMSIPWLIHSPEARLVVQMPVSANPATAFWAVQAMVSAKTP